MRNCEDTCRDPDVRLEKWLEGFYFFSSELFVITTVLYMAYRHACNSLCVEVKEGFCGVNPLHPPLYGLQELNSGHQVYVEKAFTTELSSQPRLWASRKSAYTLRMEASPHSQPNVFC